MDLSILKGIRALTEGSSAIREPRNIVLLSISLPLFPVFAFWVGRQEKLGRPALIPNSLWRNKQFSSICISVFLMWAAFSVVNQYLSLFFQTLQGLTPMTAAIYYLPETIVGTVVSVAMGFIVYRIQGDWIVFIASTLACIAPLLMAIVNPNWTYWAGVFPAVVLHVIQVDVFFTIANLVITSAFSPKVQALAGGVYNTISQIGRSVGLALSSLIAQNVTTASTSAGRDDKQALLDGYRAAFWLSFAMIVTSLLVNIWGLRGIGKVGLKKSG